MKILNKNNVKWWGNEKSETWAFKENGDWYLIKPPKKQSKSKHKGSVSEENYKINWRQFALSCLIGGILGFSAFCLFLTYILLKNEI